MQSRMMSKGTGETEPLSAPDLSFLSYRSHPLIRTFLHTYPKLKGCVTNRLSVVLAVGLKSSGLRRDSPATVRLSNKREIRAADWRELDYILKSVGAISTLFGNGDQETLDALLNERAQITKVSALRAQDLKATREGEAFSCAPNASIKDMLLYLLILKYRPKRVIETGVSHGASTRFILSAMNRICEGNLISIDLPAYNPNGRKYADGTLDLEHVPEKLGVGWLVPPEYRSRWDLRLGMSSEILPTLTGTVDLFMHDSEHSYDNMTYEYNWAHNHLTPGGFLVSDDVGKAFDDFLGAHKGQYEVIVNGLIGAARRVS
jgi:predicted O-methyltransferase YrrM